MSAPTNIQLKGEEAFRELSRQKLAWFLRYRFRAEGRTLIWNWHLDYLCDLLEAVTTREIRRLIINMPPRMLKSEVVCQTWPAWMVGREDGERSCMLSAGATAKLAERDCRKTKEIIEAPWYRNIFPLVQPGPKWTDNEWVTKGGTTRNGAGAKGTITGFGGEHLLADDLILPDESNSETIREERNQWMLETLPGRHNNQITGTIVIVQQRVHERDTTGFLLEQMRNPHFDQYMHVCLPNEAPKRTVVEFRGKVYATREKDGLLFPARLNAERTQALKASMKGNYPGQFNQTPTKLEGGRLRPALLNRIPKTPGAIIQEWGLKLSISIDLATKKKETEKDDPDYSTIQVWGRDQMFRRWLLYVWRKQTSHDQVAAALIATKRMWKVNRCYAEKIGLQHTFRSTLRLACQLRGVPFFWVNDFQMPASTDPVEKIAPFESALNAGMIYVPDGATWLPEFEAEMRAWPKGAHDDMITAAGYICAEFDQAVGVGDQPPPDADRGDAPRADSLVRRPTKKSGLEDW